MNFILIILIFQVSYCLSSTNQDETVADTKKKFKRTYPTKLDSTTLYYSIQSYVNNDIIKGALRLPIDSTITLNAKIPQYNDMMGQFERFNFDCQNSGYFDVNKKDYCKCPSGYSGQTCSELKASDNDCTDTVENTVSSEEQTISVSGKINCTYRIKASEEKKVSVTISNVKTGVPSTDKKCMPETGFELKHRNDKSPAGVCLCGTYSSIPPITSEGDDILIIYNGLNEDDSFTFSYTESKSEEN